jgi:hypothetical protein
MVTLKQGRHHESARDNWISDLDVDKGQQVKTLEKIHDTQILIQQPHQQNKIQIPFFPFHTFYLLYQIPGKSIHDHEGQISHK